MLKRICDRVKAFFDWLDAHMPKGPDHQSCRKRGISTRNTTRSLDALSVPKRRIPSEIEAETRNMSDRVVLANADGNFSVELSPEEARNLIEVQQRERLAFSKFSLMAAMLGAGAGLQFGGGNTYRPSGERCIECGQKQPPGKPRKCKACR